MHVRKTWQIGQIEPAPKRATKKKGYTCPKNKVDKQIRAMFQNTRSPGTRKLCVYLDFMVDRVDKDCSKEINPKKWYT